MVLMIYIVCWKSVKQMKKLVFIPAKYYSIYLLEMNMRNNEFAQKKLLEKIENAVKKTIL